LQAYVHNDCLVQWLRARPSSDLKCSICRAPYNVRKEQMTYADMRKLAFTVLSLAVMLTGTACMAWVKLKRFAWLAESNLLEGNNPWHALAAVVFGIFNLRRVYSHSYEAFRRFYSGVGEVNNGRVVRVENRDGSIVPASPPSKKQKQR
jgi:hypothetical protein